MQETAKLTNAADWEPAGLEGCECTQCRRRYFPKRSVCTECGSRNTMKDVLIDGPGTLYSFSVVHVAPKTFNVPYAVGYVDLPGNVRVLGQIGNWTDTPLKQGMRMEIGRGPIATEADGSTRRSFVFHAIPNSVRT